MSVPGIVHSTLDGEEIAARVSLGGDDELFITPTRTIVYRADGLLSDESADEFSHDADRLTLSEGRRKTKFTLEYALDGERQFTIPAGKTDDVLHPVLAGVLNGNDITEPGETVVKTYRFSELTLIITSNRLVKHIGGAVWDDDYEEYHFDDVTNLAFEDGSVATQIVLTANGRPQRIKAPNEEANDLRERLKRALFEYHDVRSLEELNETVGDGEDDGIGRDSSVDFGGGVDPLDADPPEPEDHEVASEGTSDASDAESTDPLAGGATDVATADSESVGAVESDAEADQATSQAASASVTPTDRSPNRDREGDGAAGAAQAEAGTGAFFEDSVDSGAEAPSDAGVAPQGSGADSEPSATATGADPELLERIEALEDTVERQTEIVERQQQTIEQLIAELRQGR
ncbi:DUF7115 domain-containing protein [Natrinema salifodinae]|uniref:DUF7115 domain-containing protein n=1 Tax=Natrinema salifodinae TaxID=1202768 RepID=A0A1I0MKK0_9EURY|nr:hypothetical protein [Natrinema salifodinae]SEV88366.1 hypothetical protein SAMN05216285_1036 [Natrinema salifodinae]